MSETDEQVAMKSPEQIADGVSPDFEAMGLNEGFRKTMRTWIVFAIEADRDQREPQGEPSDARVARYLRDRGHYIPEELRTALTEPPSSENAYTGIPISEVIRSEQGESALHEAVTRSLAAHQQISDAEDRLRLGGGA